mgnify:CR=1 FL=1
MKRKILITGSSGYIAKNIAIKLKKKNFLIYGIGRGKWTKKDYKKWGYIDQINGRLTKKNLSKYNFKFDFIIHCAGSGIVGLRKKKDFNNNVKSTISLLNFIRKTQNKPKIIFMSSYSIYGNNFKDSISEKFVTKPVSIYAINKKKAENLLLNFSKKYTADLMILRIASLYGEGLKKQLIYDACLKISKGLNNFFGTGREKRDFIHISDLVNIVLYFCKKGFSNSNIVNCGSGRGRKIKDVLKLISKDFKMKNKIIFNKKKLNTNPINLISNIKQLKRIGVKPNKNFKIGVKQYVKWFKKNIL